VSPFGDTLLGGGASEEGIQRGKPRRGRGGTAFALRGDTGRAGVIKQIKGGYLSIGQVEIVRYKPNAEAVFRRGRRF